MGSSMFSSARALVLAGIAERTPQLSPAETRVQLFLRFYGRDFSPEATARIVARLRAT